MSLIYAFDESRLHGFTESPLHARNRPVRLLTYYKLESFSPAVDEVAGKDMTSILGAPTILPAQIGNGYFKDDGALVGWTIKNTDAQWDLSEESRFTIRAWFWYSGTPGAIVYGEDIIRSSSYALVFHGTPGGSATFIFSLFYPFLAATSVVSPEVSAGWHRVVAVYRRKSISIKIDNDPGITVVSANTLQPGASSVQITAGNLAFYTPSFGVDELGVWVGELSRTQLLDDWNSGAGRTFPDVPGWP